MSAAQTSPAAATETGNTLDKAAFQPYVRDSANLTELTPSAVIMGSVLGIIFGASSLYLFLKVGMTVSASIPVAVLAITIFRGLSRAFGLRRATILENNIVQTAGSAGESIAFGVGATMPAFLLLGYELEWTRVMLVAVLGGLLGILMMIPLRRSFIVKQHGILPYPEGTACAKVLIVGEQGGSNARTVFLGFGFGFLYKFMTQGLKLWSDVWSKTIDEITGYSIVGYKKAVVSIEADPALLGVGYIIGPRISSVMVAGSLLASLLLVPLIAYFGDALPAALPPGQKPISKMSAGEISGQYVRYIGAGAVATGGILSMINALPLILASIAGSVGDFRSRASAAGGGVSLRTERDLPIALVFLGSLAIIVAVAASNLIPTNLPGRLTGGALIVLFGFLFVTVSSRITGVIGSSSNPISGMTIATLLLTCLIFVLLDWVGPEYRITALSIAGIVCIASSNGGTTSQDLKTGYLVGATPWKQQVSILIGALISAVVMGGTLLLLNAAYTTVHTDTADLPTIAAPKDEVKGTALGKDGVTYGIWRVSNPRPGALPGEYLVNDAGKAVQLNDYGIGGRMTKTQDGTPIKKFNPPQPRLFATLIEGIMKQELPWGLVILGAVLAIVMQLCGVSALAFAVGVYLPLSTTLPIFIGGALRGIVDSVLRLTSDESETSPGTLMSTGLIAGGSLAGIGLALLVVFEEFGKQINFSKQVAGGEPEFLLPALGSFAVLAVILLLVAILGKRSGPVKMSHDQAD